MDRELPPLVVNLFGQLPTGEAVDALRACRQLRAVLRVWEEDLVDEALWGVEGRDAALGIRKMTWGQLAIRLGMRPQSVWQAYGRPLTPREADLSRLMRNSW